VGTPDHPHETVTYIVEGSMQHKDSAGKLEEGWVQWMTAGSSEAITPAPCPCKYLYSMVMVAH